METILNTPLLNIDIDQCNICLLDISDRDSDLQYSLCKCNGIFHQSCWNKWIQQNKHCPTCRRPHPHPEKKKTSSENNSNNSNSNNSSNSNSDTEILISERGRGGDEREEIQITIRIPNLTRQTSTDYNCYFNRARCMCASYLLQCLLFLAICFACGLGLICLNHTDGCTQFPNFNKIQFIYHILFLMLIGFIGIIFTILLLNRCFLVCC